MHKESEITQAKQDGEISLKYIKKSESDTINKSFNKKELLKMIVLKVY